MYRFPKAPAADNWHLVPSTGWEWGDETRDGSKGGAEQDGKGKGAFVVLRGGAREARRGEADLDGSGSGASVVLKTVVVHSTMR